MPAEVAIGGAAIGIRPIGTAFVVSGRDVEDALGLADAVAQESGKGLADAVALTDSVTVRTSVSGVGRPVPSGSGRFTPPPPGSARR